MAKMNRTRSGQTRSHLPQSEKEMWNKLAPEALTFLHRTTGWIDFDRTVISIHLKVAPDGVPCFFSYHIDRRSRSLLLNRCMLAPEETRAFQESKASAYPVRVFMCECADYTFYDAGYYRVRTISRGLIRLTYLAPAGPKLFEKLANDFVVHAQNVDETPSFHDFSDEKPLERPGPEMRDQIQLFHMPTRKLLQRRVVNSRTFSVPCTVDGVDYDSLLEGRHAFFMRALSIPFHPHPCSISIDPLHRRYYTPDSLLPLQHIFLEIKPARPYQEDIEKCARISLETGFCFVILFGGWAAPFANVPERGCRRAYPHRDGIRGIGIGPDGRQMTGDFVWMQNVFTQETQLRQSVAGVDESDGPWSWDTPRLIQMYAAAARYQPQLIPR